MLIMIGGHAIDPATVTRITTYQRREPSFGLWEDVTRVYTTEGFVDTTATIKKTMDKINDALAPK